MWRRVNTWYLYATCVQEGKVKRGCVEDFNAFKRFCRAVNMNALLRNRRGKS